MSDLTDLKFVTVGITAAITAVVGGYAIYRGIRSYAQIADLKQSFLVYTKTRRDDDAEPPNVHIPYGGELPSPHELVSRSDYDNRYMRITMHLNNVMVTVSCYRPSNWLVSAIARTWMVDRFYAAFSTAADHGPIPIDQDARHAIQCAVDMLVGNLRQ